MPELQHYALAGEALEILRELLDHKLVAIPELPKLTEPALARYDAYGPELVDSLQRYRCLLLEGAFTKHPLRFDRRDAGSAAGTYYVDQDTGPRVRWCLPGLDTADRPTLFPGTVSYRASYLNPDSRQWEPASDELKTAFKQIVEIFKRHLVRTAHGSGERLWVGPAAKQAIERGEAFIDR
jgi:hypothetical protein